MSHHAATRTETSFELATPPSEAWSALERLRVERTDHRSGPDEWWLPGFTCRTTELAAAPERQLTVRKDEDPCAGTTISMTFEHAGSGSRITVVQSGFDPAFVELAGEQLWLHANRIFADVELFFRTGAIGGRAWRWPAVDLGFEASSGSTAVHVDSTRPDGWATRVGLEPGDVILALAGASLYGFADLQTVLQTLRPGTELDVTWSRGARIREASSPI